MLCERFLADGCGGGGAGLAAVVVVVAVVVGVDVDCGRGLTYCGKMASRLRNTRTLPRLNKFCTSSALRSELIK